MFIVDSVQKCLNFVVAEGSDVPDDGKDLSQFRRSAFLKELTAILHPKVAVLNKLNALHQTQRSASDFALGSGKHGHFFSEKVEIPELIINGEGFVNIFLNMRRD
jgi:hypothetical protein